MSYSRRQLYAMGEPLGDSVTRKKAGGGLVLGDGGGNNPTSSNTTVSSTELPSWATGYAKDTLANAANLTDINKNPYKTYGQPRIAGFSPMQEQAQTAASNMSAGPEAFGRGVNAYMSPYMQNVVDVQKQEAARQSGIMGTQQQAQATQAGAFGGSRDAIMRAERERNLGQQMNQIQAQGSQAAYDQAANQFRQGITQDTAINQLQNQYGGQQQQLAQRGLDVNYQDFLNQQNYPYKQIGFMSDLIRGLPLGQQSTQSMYQAPPSMMQNIGALGMGAYGAKQLGMFAEGGQVSSYADGGEINPMDDPNAMTAAVAKLSDEQLQQIMQHPSSAAELQAAKLELATRASERGGLAGAYNMAQGGVVAFAHGGIPGYKGGVFVNPNADSESEYVNTANVNDELDALSEDGIAALERDQVYASGDPKAHNEIVQEFLAQIRAGKNPEGVSLRSDEEMENAALARFSRLNERIGGDKTYAGIQKQIADMRGENEGSLREGKGLAALQAAGAMLQGNDPMRGIGAAGAAFASSYAPALAAKRRADQSFTEMNINLAKAQRAEKAGLLKEADAYIQSAEANKINANKAATLARKAGLEALAQAARATKPTAFRPAAAPKPSVYEEYEAASPEKRARMEKFAGITHPAVAAASVTQAGAGERSAAEIAEKQAKLAAEIAEKRAAARQQLQKDVAAEYTGAKLGMEPAYQEALTNVGKKISGAKTPDQVRQEIIAREVERRWRESQGVRTDAKAEAGAGAGAKPNISQVTGAPPGSSVGGYVQGKGYKVLDSKGNHIGFVQ